MKTAAMRKPSQCRTPTTMTRCCPSRLSTIGLGLSLDLRDPRRRRHGDRQGASPTARPLSTCLMQTALDARCWAQTSTAADGVVEIAIDVPPAAPSRLTQLPVAAAVMTKAPTPCPSLTPTTTTWSELLTDASRIKPTVKLGSPTLPSGTRDWKSQVSDWYYGNLSTRFPLAAYPLAGRRATTVDRNRR